MTRKLILYTNCSKGGVTTVIRNRALAEPETEFAAVFLNDRGGSESFVDIPNIHVRIVRRDRAAAYLSHILKTYQFDAVSILSEPDLANALAQASATHIEYEFHSSDTTVIQRELTVLDLDKIHSIVVPSKYLRGIVESLLPRGRRAEVIVRPNLVDTETFTSVDASQHGSFGRLPAAQIVLWVGRFDKGKGYKQFLRILGKLPPGYQGIAVVSLESDPARAAEFYYECDANGVADRITLFSNISQLEMARLLRGTRDSGGFLLSTSLMESFGYSVAEAVSTGTPVLAYDLPALREIPDPQGLITFVPIGSFEEAVRTASTIGA